MTQDERWLEKYNGKRDTNGGILEGIPVVSEIPSRFDVFSDFISKAKVPQGRINFWDLFRANSYDVEQSKQRMLEDIDSLITGVLEHATIDTYARKLYLTQNHRDFEKLKDVLCIFFYGNRLNIDRTIVMIHFSPMCLKCLI